ncbi:UDP-N-acetylmuramate dehydrogenase [Candidatus Bipolaricaulota bacterium]
MRDPEIPDSIHPVVAEGRSLWPLTSMRIGGSARWLIQPETEREVNEVFAWIQTHHLPYVVLGGGTNVLFSDSGFPGVVLLTNKLTNVRFDDLTVTAACGENLSGLAHRLNQAGLSGMEWACGIPGTIGGAVTMNAGAHGSDIASVLVSVRTLSSEGERELTPEQLELGYRSSAFLAGKLEGIVLDATFTLRHDKPQQCLSREREILEARRRTQPIGASSGCIFRNPETGPSAGELLDRAGCKGLRIGSAIVSELHANYIINQGENNANEVLELVQMMRQRVVEMHAILLDLEVVILSL